jgi:hypothetical protein
MLRHTNVIRKSLKVGSATMLAAVLLTMVSPRPASAALPSGYYWSGTAQCMFGGGIFAKTIPFKLRFFSYGNGQYKLDGYTFSGNYTIYKARLSFYRGTTFYGQVNTNVPYAKAYTRIDLKNYFNQAYEGNQLRGVLELYSNDISPSPCAGAASIPGVL